jgi:ElaB/YqjD/DUF883 family membrane-anchored ribosome-binding protein
MSSGAANVVQAVTPDDLSFPDLSDVASGISMDDLPPEIRQTLEQNGITVDELRSEAREAFRDVVSQQEQQRSLSVLQGALTDALRNPGDIGSEVDEAVESLFAGPDAVFSQEDRDEVLTDLQERLGLTPEQTDQLVQSLEQRIEAAVEEVRQTLGQVQQQALEIAQRASSVLAATAAWLSFASLLASLPPWRELSRGSLTGSSATAWAITSERRSRVGGYVIESMASVSKRSVGNPGFRRWALARSASGSRSASQILVARCVEKVSDRNLLPLVRRSLPQVADDTARSASCRRRGAEA